MENESAPQKEVPENAPQTENPDAAVPAAPFLGSENHEPPAGGAVPSAPAVPASEPVPVEVEPPLSPFGEFAGAPADASADCGCGGGQDEEERRKLLNRLHRLIGQMHGVERMVEEGAPCMRTLRLISAVGGGLRGIWAAVLARHMKECVSEAFREGDERMIDDIVEHLRKIG
ncbi:MAG: metal-sensitive transcriptional regulator [Candidatus Spyradosoma sp.]